MKIAVIGASGNAGARITAELARRGHAVTAIARNPEKIAKLANVIPTKGDASDEADLTRLLRGHDAAISSIHFLASDPAKVAPGVRLVTTPSFPAQYKAEAEKGAAFLDRLAQEKELNWTFISPSPCSLRANGPASSGSEPISC
jgi:putative NADH-flavin reductase